MQICSMMKTNKKDLNEETDLVGMRSNGCGSAAKRLEALSDTNHRETSGLKRPSGQRAQKLKRNGKATKVISIFSKSNVYCFQKVVHSQEGLQTKQSCGDSLKIPDDHRVRNSADQCLKPKEDLRDIN